MRSHADTNGLTEITDYRRKLLLDDGRLFSGDFYLRPITFADYLCKQFGPRSGPSERQNVDPDSGPNRLTP